ncbi:MAG: hypothetical protein WC601_06755, partial [Desulfotomaculaceae bacterium]
MNETKMATAEDKDLVAKVMQRCPSLPFLAVETDGNPFPQVIEARLEIFCLQVKRLHDRIQEIKAKGLYDNAARAENKEERQGILKHLRKAR